MINYKEITVTLTADFSTAITWRVFRAHYIFLTESAAIIFSVSFHMLCLLEGPD
jgi:hypothetical protein